MKYGVCGEPEIASILAKAGYDYIELHVQRDLKTEEDEASFEPQLGRICALPLPAAAANCFLPGWLKITGPDVDWGAVERYVAMALGRAARAGIETVVFGSGGARRVPEDYDPARAWAQLLDFGRIAASIAAEHEITLVAEPLNRRECNVLTSVAESADYVRQVDHPNMWLLVDAYHWAVEEDSYQDLVEAMPLIRHAHIATYGSRMAPGLEPCDFSPFFRALREGGYAGRLSIEGKWADMSQDAATALAELERFARQGSLQ
jgi:sugar phosphate isomerase/epimerase